MTSAPVDTQAWSRQRWWMTIALVLALQTALVFVLENRSSAVPRKTIAAPVIHWQETVSFESLAVSDPTLFVLPHREGFSGEAWLDTIPPRDFFPAEWTEPPRWLALSASTLGVNFKDFLAANAAPPFQTLATIEPPRISPELFPMETAPAQSTLRIEGGLAKRGLLSTPQLQLWPSAELLTNSIVQLLVDAQGHTFSAVLLLRHSSGKQAEADDRALELATAAEFEPVATSGSGPTMNETNALRLGTMIFEWVTLPMPATNAPAETP
jgi:hypothetical protein